MPVDFQYVTMHQDLATCWNEIGSFYLYGTSVSRTCLGSLKRKLVNQLRHSYPSPALSSKNIQQHCRSLIQRFSDGWEISSHSRWNQNHPISSTGQTARCRPFLIDWRWATQGMERSHELSPGKLPNNLRLQDPLVTILILIIFSDWRASGKNYKKH